MHFDGRSWCHLSTGATTALRGVWGFGDDRVFVVGDEGAVVHFDGRSWRLQRSGTSATLFSVWGASPSAVFAVGANGTILRWDGQRWRGAASIAGGRLMALSGHGAEMAIAAGEGGLVVRWDGASWERLQVGIRDDIVDLWVDADQVSWLVTRNDGLYRLGRDGGLAERVPVEGGLFSGIWGAGEHRFLVGRFGAVRRLNVEGGGGDELSTGSDAHFRALWGSAEDDLYVVGEHGTIMRFDGQRWWSQSSLPRAGLADGAGFGGRPGRPQGGFHGVWGIPNEVLLLVGFGGTILSWEGDEWRTRESGTEERLVDVWGTSPTNVWAVGDHGTVLRFDGEQWSAVEVETTEDLEAVWGSGAEDVFIVGAAGTILRWDGEAMHLQLGITHASLHDVWGSGPSNVWAVGHSGTVLRWNGSEWAVAEPITGRHLLAIWGMEGDPSTIWLAGRGYGAAFRRECVMSLSGEELRPLGLAARPIDALWGRGPEELFAAGLSGTYRWNGESWTLLETGVQEPIRALWGDESQLFGVGAFGVVERQELGSGAVVESHSGDASAEAGDGG